MTRAAAKKLRFGQMVCVKDCRGVVVDVKPGRFCVFWERSIPMWVSHDAPELMNKITLKRKPK